MLSTRESGIAARISKSICHASIYVIPVVSLYSISPFPRLISSTSFFCWSTCETRLILWSRSGQNFQSTWALLWRLWMKRCSPNWPKFLPWNQVALCCVFFFFGEDNSDLIASLHFRRTQIYWYLFYGNFETLQYSQFRRFMYTCVCKKWLNTVDGRNLAPPGMYKTS